MSQVERNNINQTDIEEILLQPQSGMGALVGNILLMIVSIFAFIIGILYANIFLGVILIIVGSIYAFIVGPILFGGLKLLKPNEALVLTLFGKYYGTIKGAGFYFVNPFASAINPASSQTSTGSLKADTGITASVNGFTVNTGQMPNKKISLKAMTLNNDKQKVNDQLGNPIIIGIVVIWKVVNTAKAVFNVDNFTEFLSIQCDSALRDIVRLYPYDLGEDNSEKSLRSSSQEIAEDLTAEIGKRVEIAGLEIVEARITNLAYSSEIAAAMLQRQQASAIVDARTKIVEGAVGMVEMALEKLNDKDIVHLDEKQKATMVSNLMVVLCGNKDVQPVISSDPYI